MAAPGYISTNPVALASGDAISVSLVYDSSNSTLLETLLETLTDATAGTSFSNTYSGVDLISIVGSSTAYVGSTGGTGGLYSTQTIGDFQFTSTVPEPNSLLLLGSGLSAALEYFGGA